MNSKRKYLIIAIAAGLLLLGAGYLLGQGDSNTALAQGKLEVMEKYYDFGTVGLDNVSHSYKIKNIGEGPLTIAKVSTSCGCTTAQIKTATQKTRSFGMDHGNLPKADFVLEPNEEAEIIATYNPLAHGRDRAEGKFRRLVYLKTENPSDEYALTFDVMVDADKKTEKNPMIKADLLEHDFGQIKKTDGIVSKDFKISNSGNAMLTISDIKTSCSCTSAELSKMNIEPGTDADLTIKFDPNYHEEPQGKLERIVTLFTNDSNNSEFELKIYAEIID